MRVFDSVLAGIVSCYAFIHAARVDRILGIHVGIMMVLSFYCSSAWPMPGMAIHLGLLAGWTAFPSR